MWLSGKLVDIYSYYNWSNLRSEEKFVIVGVRDRATLELWPNDEVEDLRENAELAQAVIATIMEGVWTQWISDLRHGRIEQ
jgi:hypothetical protein